MRVAVSLRGSPDCVLAASRPACDPKRPDKPEYTSSTKCSTQLTLARRQQRKRDSVQLNTAFKRYGDMSPSSAPLAVVFLHFELKVSSAGYVYTRFLMV